MNKLSIERLSDFERDPSSNFLTRSEMMEAIKELIALRKELKGGQVPVGIIRKVQQGLHVTLYQSIPEGTELFTAHQKPVISKEKLCDWLEDNFDIDDSQRDAFAQCFAHNCE